MLRYGKKSLILYLRNLYLVSHGFFRNRNFLNDVNMKILQIFFMVFAFSLFTVSPGSGQPDQSAVGLFDSNEVLQVKLTGNIGVLISDLEEDPDEYPALLSYADENGEYISIPVEVRTRGNFRRDPDNCNFPPLRIILSEDHMANTIFEGQDEIKLVTHCMTNQPEYEQFLFKEYSIYRLYNHFTPFSFRVRLAEISYIEQDNPDDQITSFAFFIERPKYMAERNNGKIINIENFSSSDLDEESFNILALFQYMIANNDWFIQLLHNIELVTLDPLSPPIPVPYDFDWAGLVEAPYRNSLRDSLESFNADRFYKGICGSRKEFIALFDLFEEKKDEVFKLYQEFELLDIEHKAKIIHSISSFYGMIERPGNAIQILRRDCNSW